MGSEIRDSRWKYIVVPIRPGVEEGASCEMAAGLAQKTINSHAGQGWEFVELSSMQVDVKPGCLGMLFGRKHEIEVMSVAVFRRSVVEGSGAVIPESTPGRRQGESVESWANRMAAADMAAFKAKTK
jgi:hypothetical protein